MEMNDWDLEVDDSTINENTKTAESDPLKTLPEGNYEFTVMKVEHSTYQPKEGKTKGITSPCKQITVGLLLDGGGLGKGWANEKFFCWPTSLFRILSFLKSVGEIEDGFKGKIGDHLDGLKGLTGICHVVKEEFTRSSDGSNGEHNVVKRFFKPSEKPTLSVKANEDFSDIPF